MILLVIDMQKGLVDDELYNISLLQRGCLGRNR